MYLKAVCLYGLLVLATQASVFKVSVERELAFYRKRVRILDHILLQENCITTNSNAGSTRAIIHDDSVASIQLEVEIKYYQELTNLLVTCRKGSSSSPALTTGSTEKTTQPVTTVITATTTAAPTAKEMTTPTEPMMKTTTTATTTTIALSANETTTSTKAAATTTKSAKRGKINLARGKD